MNEPLTLGIAYLGGLVTAFTPCVYPLIPVTLGIIGSRFAASHLRGFLSALVFVLGLAVVYSALGFTAATTGRLLGGFTQRPVVAFTMAFLLIWMGLGMLGLFEFRLPFRLNQWLAKKGGGGLWGTFVLGAASGLLAAPCSGPVVVAILAYVASQSNPVLGFLLLFTFSLGLGTPFLVLGTFSHWLSKLPKSGVWTGGVKALLGVALIFAAFLYVKPFFHFPSRTPPPEPVSDVAWVLSETEGLSAASMSRKPAVIDFFAEWCEACKELDRYTYADARVSKQLRSDFVPIKIDSTRSTEDNRSLIEKYRVSALPTVLFVGSCGNVFGELTVTGFVGADDFLERLGRATLLNRQKC